MEKAFLQKKNVNDSANATTKFLMIEKAIGIFNLNFEIDPW